MGSIGTGNISLTDVTAEVGGDDLSECFSLSTDAYFDPIYKGSKDRLSNFKGYTDPELTNALLSVWDLEDSSSSNINDSTSNNQDGSSFNSFFQPQQSGKIGSYSMGMTSTAYISNTVPQRPPYGYSMSLWFYPTTQPDFVYRNVMGVNLFSTVNAREGVGIISPSITTSSTLYFKDGSSYYSTGDSLSANTWYHIVLTRTSGGTAVVYLNGTNTYSRSSLGSISGGSTYNYYLGRDTGYNFNTGEGRYDQFGFWTERVLTQSDVNTLYNGGAGFAYSNW